MTKAIKPTARNYNPFTWGTRTYVMGIINLSPDSFSGDGISSVEDAIALAKRMEAEGADIIDIGGESTRPEATPISAEEEIRRIVPAITRLYRELNIPLSIDTYKYDVARAAIAAGATILNDISGLKTDARLAALAAEHNIPIIVTANQRGRQITGDIMTEAISDLRRAVQYCKDVGVASKNIIVDPGLGFGKTTMQNLAIINRLEELKVLGCPIMIGPSRKSFIGLTLGLPNEECLEGTTAAAVIGIARGADVVRVHDVKQMVRAARLSDAIIRGRS